ncbi:MAG: heme-binding protein [Nostoc sp.]|uniref:GlcG/HbpS family heme-binding protein n=1 Tax=Nostoc sp. TaxID=1180 RepID=UPI002FFAC135
MLTSRQAHTIITAGETRAAAMGVSVNIAVLDASARLKAFSRMDGAVLGSIDVAIKKASTAALFQTSSEAVWDYCKPDAPAHALEHTNGGLAPFAGGLPLKGVDGEMLGAISVSGGAVAQDLKIAEAGVSAINT